VRNISVYLAGPIDGLDDRGRSWREEAAVDLPMGVVLFSPAHAYVGASKATAHEIHMLNSAMVAVCDAMIANLAGPGWGLGTIREIERGKLGEKPVAVIVEPDCQDSLMLYDLMVCHSFDEALVAVMEAFNEQRRRPNLPFPFSHMRFQEPDDE